MVYLPKTFYEIPSKTSPREAKLGSDFTFQERAEAYARARIMAGYRRTKSRVSKSVDPYIKFRQEQYERYRMRYDPPAKTMRRVHGTWRDVRTAYEPLVPEYAGRDRCEICGYLTLEIHCKVVCRNCGNTRDCSDP